MLAWRGAWGTLFSDWDIIHQRIQSSRTLFTSEYCPGGHYSRGDIIHGGTLFTPTTASIIMISLNAAVHYLRYLLFGQC